MPDVTPELCREYRGDCRVAKRNGVPHVEKADEKIHASVGVVLSPDSRVRVDALGQLVLDSKTTYRIVSACPAFGPGWLHLSLVVSTNER
jgi:hypothetical protein